MTDEEPKDDGTVTWMGITLTREHIAHLRSQGLNPWLTAVSGSPVPARESAGQPPA